MASCWNWSPILNSIESRWWIEALCLYNGLLVWIFHVSWSFSYVTNSISEKDQNSPHSADVQCICCKIATVLGTYVWDLLLYGHTGSPDGVLGCEEQPQRHRAISPTLIRQHRQWVCCIFRQEETTEGKAIALQVRVHFNSSTTLQVSVFFVSAFCAKLSTSCR